ncbi:MAG TPA: OB-fold domain-containing protein [Candidatus Binatia bacterium]|jgi:uncharacterized OB-fold protein|nr:OB-fold domain-containing protein [Candidatus Binatia bacterium]
MATRPIADGLFVDDGDAPRLVAGRCAACGGLHFPRGTTCPYCAADGCTEARVGPAARLWLYTAVTTRPPGYRGPVPYGFGVVELDGGLRVVTRLTEADPARLRPGLAMRLVVEPLFTDDDGAAVLSYAFRPEDT